MSQQEFDQADAQVIGIVEGHAHPDAKKKAARICDAREGMGGMKIAAQNCVNPQSNAKAADLRRQILLTAIQVLSCILVAALFVVALMDGSFVTFLVNAGVLVCGMVAAILVDRAIRTWRKG